jgi:hypothetical protein
MICSERGTETNPDARIVVEGPLSETPDTLHPRLLRRLRAAENR